MRLPTQAYRYASLPSTSPPRPRRSAEYRSPACVVYTGSVDLADASAIFACYADQFVVAYVFGSVAAGTAVSGAVRGGSAPVRRRLPKRCRTE